MNRLEARAETVSSACRSWRLAVLAALSFVPLGGLAQELAGGRGLTVLTSIDASSDFAVNSRLGGRDAGDLTLQLRPGIALFGRGSRAVGSLNYSVGLIHRSRRGGGDDGDVAHNLAAQVSAEAIDRWMYVDATAAIERQITDPFGVQGVGTSASAQENTAEVGRASLSPYVRGALGQAISYEVRLNASAVNTRRSLEGDSTAWGASASLSSNLPGSALGWGLVASSQETEFRVGGNTTADRNTRNDRWSASLYWIPDPDLTLTLRGGQETSDAEVPVRERYANWGMGITWRPSARTRVQVEGDERYFGSAYRIGIEHRARQLSVQLGSSRSDNAGPPTGVQLSAFQLRDAQLASLIPDPAQREQQVLQDLVQRGQSPDTIVFTALVNSAITVLERHDVSVAYAGRRLALSAQFYLEKSEVLDGSGGTAGAPVKRKGYSANAGYRLGPGIRITLDAGWLTVLASGPTPGNNLRFLTAGIETSLAARTQASFGARYSEFSSTTDPYREAGIIARLNHRF